MKYSLNMAEAINIKLIRSLHTLIQIYLINLFKTFIFTVSQRYLRIFILLNHKKKLYSLFEFSIFTSEVYINLLDKLIRLFVQRLQLMGRYISLRIKKVSIISSQNSTVLLIVILRFSLLTLKRWIHFLYHSINIIGGLISGDPVV